MATKIPLTFRSAPFPLEFSGTVQDFVDALVVRLSAESSDDISFFASGSVAPTSNVGPWLKNDVTWYVWSDSLAAYVPETIEFQSLRYIAQTPTLMTGTISTTSGSTAVVGAGTLFLSQFAVNDYISSGSETKKITAVTSDTDMTTEAWDHTYASNSFISKAGAPDQNKYTLWVELDGTGKALRIRYYSSGAWRDIYETYFATVLTTAQTVALINTATADLTKNYPVIAKMAGSQIVSINGDFHTITMDTSVVDTDSAYDATTYKYTAPVSGIYDVSITLQIDNIDVDVATVEFATIAMKNGVVGPLTAGCGTSVPTPSGSRWYPVVSGLVQLAIGDTMEVALRGNDTTNTKTVTVSNSSWSVVMVRKI